jgi:hypothetical protein
MVMMAAGAASAAPGTQHEARVLKWTAQPLQRSGPAQVDTNAVGLPKRVVQGELYYVQ